MDLQDAQRDMIETIGSLVPSIHKNTKAAWKPVVALKDGPVTASKFSGAPWLSPSETWPLCGGCDRPLQLLLQLDLQSLPKPFNSGFGKGLVQLFYCRNDDGTCETEVMKGSRAFSECQVVRIVSPTTGIRRPVLPKGHDKIPPRTITRWRQTVDYPETGVTIQIDGEFAEFFHIFDGGDKLGGWPFFV